MRTHEAMLVSVIIWKHIVNNDVPLVTYSFLSAYRGSLPSPLKITFEVLADVADCFLDFVHYIAFVEHIIMADRDEFFQVVRHELTTDVKTADGLLYGPTIEERGDG